MSTRVRRIAQWSGLTTCLLTVVMWLFSTQYVLAYDGFDWAVGVEGGRAFCFLANPSGPPDEIAWARDQLHGYGGVRFHRLTSRLGTCESLGLSLPVLVHDQTRPAIVGKNLRTSPTRLLVPLWTVLVVLLAATTALGLSGRRAARAGHCQQCGYDLTGNVSGRCPECGTLIRPGTEPEQTPESTQ